MPSVGSVSAVGYVLAVHLSFVLLCLRLRGSYFSSHSRLKREFGEERSVVNYGTGRGKSYGYLTTSYV